MRRFAFIAPLAAVLAVAASAQAETPRVTVDLSPAVRAQAEKLGVREVRQQADRLAAVVERALAERGALDGAEVRLTLTDLKPNRPTFHQVSRTPGLSAIDSISIGGAAVDVEVIGPDGARRNGQYEYFSYSLEEVRGFSTWQDADRTFTRLASRLADGRLALR